MLSSGLHQHYIYLVYRHTCRQNIYAQKIQLKAKTFEQKVSLLILLKSINAKSSYDLYLLPYLNVFNSLYNPKEN